MTKTKIAAVSIFLIALGGCGMMGDKKMGDKMMKGKEAAGISAIDCFSAGGTIDNAGGSSMCKMKDGSMKPVL